MSERSLSALLDRQPIERIAVLRALYLGDLLCAVPAFRALRRRFPGARIALIGLPWARQLVERLPYLDRWLPFPGYPGLDEVECQSQRTETVLKQMRAQRFDLAIQMHGSGSISNAFVAALGARLTLGYRVGVDSRLTWSLPYDPAEHEVRRWLRLVGELGADAGDLRLECPVTLADERAAAHLLASARNRAGPLIGLHVGAKDPGRRWPPERFAALADRLVERYDASLVLTGSGSERGLTCAVRQTMRHNALDLAGQTDFGSFAALIRRLDLLVSNDTGAAHMAVATATPSVTLIGPGQPDGWEPLDPTWHRRIDSRRLAPPGLGPAGALHQLAVEPVQAACAELLSGRVGRAPRSLPLLRRGK